MIAKWMKGLDRLAKNASGIDLKGLKEFYEHYKGQFDFYEEELTENQWDKANNDLERIKMCIQSREGA